MPESTEQLSHGEPTFFVRKKVFTMTGGTTNNLCVVEWERQPTHPVRGQFHQRRALGDPG
jgi:hypothetical protein